MDWSQQTDAEILAVANPIMNNLMDASTAIDYQRHIRDFTDRIKSVLPEDRFKAICVEYQKTKGYFADRQVVAVFRRPDSVAVVWRQRFTKVAGDFVAELVLMQNGDRYQVDHVMVF